MSYGRVDLPLLLPLLLQESAGRLRWLASQLALTGQELRDVLQAVALELLEADAAARAALDGPAAIGARASPSLDHAKFCRRVQNRARAEKRGRREVPTDAAVLHAVPDTRGNPEVHVMTMERVLQFRSVLQRMPDARRSVFIARELEGKTWEEIADARGISSTAARKHNERAWADLYDAVAAWREEERKAAVPLAPPPIGADRGRRMLWALAVRLPAILGIVLFCGIALRDAGSVAEPTRPAPTFAPALAVERADPPSAGKPVHEGSAPPSTVLPSAPAPARSPKPIARVPAEEEELIACAQAALAAGNRGEARRCLETHLTMFPFGRLTLERDTLLRRVR